MRNKVWYYRNQRGLTLQQLSKLTGLSVAAISKIENDNTNDILLKNAIVLSRVGSLDEVHEVVSENVGKYPNGKWELYPMIITM